MTVMRKLTSAIFVLALAQGSDIAAAQISAPSMISGLPDVRSMSPANAAGVLQYCMKNQLVSSTAGDMALGPLTAKHNLKSSPDYSAGASGNILTHGKSFALGSLNGNLKSRACDMVLKQAQQLK